MKYKLFLIDLDDTLLDFQASEKLCFLKTLNYFGIHDAIDSIHQTYKLENNRLWVQVEKGEIKKDFLKVERFKKTLDHHNLDFSPAQMSEYYLSELPLNVVLIEGAVELCENLKKIGQIGILTNGIKETQNARIQNSKLSSLIDFVAISDECGHAKPDIRFFEYAMTKINPESKNTILMIGDRLEADILGANRFDIDSLWFNPHNLAESNTAKPTYVVKNLSEILTVLN